MNNIIIIGFMGSGKSTIAKMLGGMLQKRVVEMDKVVVGLSGRKTVNEIFEKDGEIFFREHEILAAKKIAREKNVVVSTGGGAVMNKIIIDYFKKEGTVIYLEADFDQIQKRLRKTKDRPLFMDKISARKLYTLREALYEQYSDVKIVTNNKTPEKIVVEILKKIN